MVKKKIVGISKSFFSTVAFSIIFAVFTKSINEKLLRFDVKSCFLYCVTCVSLSLPHFSKIKIVLLGIFQFSHAVGEALYMIKRARIFSLFF